MSAPAKSRRRPVTWRLGWMLPAGLALLAGLDAGLLLLGLPAPVTTDRLPVVHGMLMVMGFVGTLISLERATALGLMPAQGGFVELVPPEAGHYPIISHVMIDAERGAHGILEVTAP